MNYLQLLKYFTGYYFALRKQKRFTQKHLEPFFDECCKKCGLQLTHADRKKILIYYPAFTVLAGAENYLILLNRALTLRERWQLTYVASMASLCDDLIDEEKWSAHQLFNLLDNELDGLPESRKAKLLLALNDALYKQYPPPAIYQAFLKDAIRGQADSIKQADPAILLEEINDISKEKNGKTSLMFASLVNENWSKASSALIYQSGFVGQLVNDTYDIFKDLQDGVQTFIQRHQNIDDAELYFINEWKYLCELAGKCNLSKRQRKKLINRFACIHAYALVAFDQFRKIEKNKTINWKSASRKDLVVDMELWSTRISLLKKIIILSKIR